MSVDCLAALGSKEFARRNFWEAELRDKNGVVSWSRLIKSITPPRLSFEVADIYGGASKAYNGWKLPNTIVLNVWEPSDHEVEKYLDEWMLGKKGQKGTGVFDMDSGAFQTVSDESVLYRDLVFRTFIYEVEREEAVSVTRKSFAQELKFELENIEEDISILRKESNGDGLPAKNIKEREYIKNMELQMASIYEITKQRNAIGINEYQIIPGLDKLLAAVNGLANQAIAKIPVASNITKRFIPTIRITPPTMRKIHFIENGLPLLFDSIKYDRVQFTSAAVASEQSDDIKVLDDIKHHIEQVKAIVYKTSSGIKSDKVNLGNVKWTARQKTTSETTYNVAIQDYDVGTYDYQSGDGVSYTVNLAVRDIKRTKYPA